MCRCFCEPLESANGQSIDDKAATNHAQQPGTAERIKYESRRTHKGLDTYECIGDKLFICETFLKCVILLRQISLDQVPDKCGIRSRRLVAGCPRSNIDELVYVVPQCVEGLLCLVDLALGCAQRGSLDEYALGFVHFRIVKVVFSPVFL